MLDFKAKPIIAVIYLRPLLGYASHPGINQVIDYALEDLEVLRKCGVDAALLENEHDRPYTVEASKEVIASMSVVANMVQRQAGNYPIGSEFLINDPEASLAIAKAGGNSFIRTDYFVDRMAREEYGGEMKIDPQGLLNYRKKIAADDIQLLTDIQVKYATMLEEKTLAQSAREAYEFKSAAAVVSGRETGIAPSIKEIMEAKEGAPELPIIIGSGLSHNNLDELYPALDGAIVGSALMTDTRMDYEKIAPFMDIVRRLRQ
ncbi:BtpA/SgcQ family protein [Halobacteriovorax sp. CON-3]|uniref:BtpA/SgcQ family protein n=1 Tax=Halobacteriovorax sp. CON-3 TaxID=3157710 RepID=UPI003716255F